MNDPTSELPFTYSINARRDKAQLLGFLEDQKSLSYGAITNTAYAVSSPLHPFTRGDSLGIVLSNTGGESNTPLQYVNTGSFDVKTTDTVF